jgi:hypothetical protein
VQNCRRTRSTTQHHYKPGLDALVLGIWPPDLLCCSRHTTLAEVHTHVPLSLPGFQCYRTTITAGFELFQKGGLLLPLPWRHGIYGTWMQCPASLGLTTRYQICINGCRSSSIRHERLNLSSPIMGSPSLAEPSTSLKHRLNLYIKGPYLWPVRRNTSCCSEIV